MEEVPPLNDHEYALIEAVRLRWQLSDVEEQETMLDAMPAIADTEESNGERRLAFEVRKFYTEQINLRLSMFLHGMRRYKWHITRDIFNQNEFWRDGDQQDSASTILVMELAALTEEYISRVDNAIKKFHSAPDQGRVLRDDPDEVREDDSET